MARGTIKLPEEDYNKHNQRRKKMGLSWAEYIDGQTPHPRDLEEMMRRIVRQELDNYHD